MLCTAIKLHWAASYVYAGLQNNTCLFGTGVKQLEGLMQLGIETRHLLALLYIDLSHNFSCCFYFFFCSEFIRDVSPNFFRPCQGKAESNQCTNTTVWNASNEGCPSAFSEEGTFSEFATSQETTKSETNRV